jgi:hypothetical protein
MGVDEFRDWIATSRLFGCELETGVVGVAREVQTVLDPSAAQRRVGEFARERAIGKDERAIYCHRLSDVTRDRVAVEKRGVAVARGRRQGPAIESHSGAGDVHDELLAGLIHGEHPASFAVRDAEPRLVALDQHKIAPAERADSPAPPTDLSWRARSSNREAEAPGRDTYGMIPDMPDFKELTPANWQQPDPVSTQFGRDSRLVGPVTMDGADWARAFLSVDLKPHVPGDVRGLFEVARGALLTAGSSIRFSALGRSSSIESWRPRSRPGTAAHERVQHSSRRSNGLCRMESSLSSTANDGTPFAICAIGPLIPNNSR